MLYRMDDHFIRWVCFKNILSFKDFKLTDLKRINIFIGGNSSGKSNIIRATIGFVHNEDHTSVRNICFADDTMITNPLNDDSAYRDLYFEIPPFRNLIISEGCALDGVKLEIRHY